MAYDKLRRAHPGKRIVIAEFGWPSAGYNMHNAEPGRIEQAMVLREFVARANAYGIDYNIIEAFDQPWKTNEGGVGMYWGMFDAPREAKFAWTGPINDPDHWKLAGLALAARAAAVAADPRQDARDRKRGGAAGCRREYGRRLVRGGVRVLGAPLLRMGRGLRSRARRSFSSFRWSRSHWRASRRSPRSRSAARPAA